jgi:hypothetical protein
MNIEQHVSSFAMDLVQLGAVSAAEQQRIESHLAGCERCRLAVAAAQESRDYFERSVRARGLAKLRTPPRRRWIWWLVASPALAAVVLLLVFRARPPEFSIKGGPAFAIYSRHAGQVSLVHDGDTLHAGDEVRFVAVSETLPYLLVCSVDGTRKASIYFPFDGKESGTVELRSRVELPGSVVLDEAAGPERIFALFSSKPITAADARAALQGIGSEGAAAIRRTQRLPVAADAQVTMVVEKAL